MSINPDERYAGYVAIDNVQVSTFIRVLISDSCVFYKKGA